MPNMTYAQLKYAFGSQVFDVSELYVECSSPAAQVKQPLLFMKYDSEGNQTYFNIATNISPFQFQDALFYNLKKRKLDMVLDGRDNLQFTLLPLANMTLQLYIKTLTVEQYLAIKSGYNNFVKMETLLGNFNFFNQFTEQISE